MSNETDIQLQTAEWEGFGINPNRGNNNHLKILPKHDLSYDLERAEWEGMGTTMKSYGQLRPVALTLDEWKLLN